MFYVRRKTGAHNVCRESFLGRIEPGQPWTGCWRKSTLPASRRDRQWPSAISSHVGIAEKKVELVEELICSHESALHVYKNPYEIGAMMDISRSSVWHIAKHDLRLRIYKPLSALL